MENKKDYDPLADKIVLVIDPPNEPFKNGLIKALVDDTQLKDIWYMDVFECTDIIDARNKITQHAWLRNVVLVMSASAPTENYPHDDIAIRIVLDELSRYPEIKARVKICIIYMTPELNHPDLNMGWKDVVVLPCPYDRESNEYMVVDFPVTEFSYDKYIKQAVGVVRGFVNEFQKDINHELEVEFENIIVGKSDAISRVKQNIDAAVSTDAKVLITGETGVGKEIVAREIHKRSRRSEMSYIVLNCAAIPSTMVEAELFGYEKGAFTGADRSHQGHFEYADGGTIFLDEIGELSLEVQVKLLRVIENGELYRIGSTKVIKIDVRIIAATNRDLQEMVERGAFREDLYYRLNVCRIDVAPLRERPDDIPLLANHFLKQIGTKEGKKKVFRPDAISAIKSYPWPGNVRELQNFIEQIYIFTSVNMISANDVNADLQKRLKYFETGILLPLADVEKKHILFVLEGCEGNQKRAAKLLKIDPKTLYNKLSSYGLMKSRE
jgi:DNA-binding NtrC family response regulator